MRRISIGLAAVILLMPAAADMAAADSDSFSLRWAAIDPPAKGDRLSVPATPNESAIEVFTEPSMQMTVARKSIRPARKPDIPAGQMPGDRAGGRDKVLDGCDPSFSPVIVPAKANVAGRCVASRETPGRVASLAR